MSVQRVRATRVARWSLVAHLETETTATTGFFSTPTECVWVCGCVCVCVCLCVCAFVGVWVFLYVLQKSALVLSPVNEFWGLGSNFCIHIPWPCIHRIPCAHRIPGGGTNLRTGHPR